MLLIFYHVVGEHSDTSAAANYHLFRTEPQPLDLFARGFNKVIHSVMTRFRL